MLPAADLAWWYQFYFATERGRAGYDQYRREFAKLIWHTASPQWNFGDATFNRSAASFDNADHVSIVIHNYRWRLVVADGETQYDDLEKQLAAGPVIALVGGKTTNPTPPTVIGTRVVLDLDDLGAQGGEEATCTPGRKEP